MQLTYTAFVLGSLATLAAANAPAKREFQFPDTVPMHKRQTSGPAYECHASCGYTIMNARDEGYCESAEWKQLLDDCLKCANQYELWPDYGTSVEAAAKGCGIDAVPSDAAAEATPSSAAAVSTVSADNLETMPTFVDASTPAAAPGSSETSAIIVTPAESSTIAATQSVMTTAASASTPAATDAPVTATVSGAASTMFSGVLVLGAALLAAVNMM